MTPKISLWELFFTFAKIGAMTFGGGYAMLPIIQRELVEKKHWITETQLIDFFAISQVTPGIIAVNVASLCGYKGRGIAGATAATIGVVVPSVIIITLVAAFFQAFTNHPLVERVFAALRIGICVLIINALIPIFKKAVIDTFSIILVILSAIAFGVFLVSPVYIVIFCALAGIVYAKIKGAAK